MTTHPLISEGKTKQIFDQGDGTVLIVNKDAITAGDGAKQDAFEGKAEDSNRTNREVMRLLRRRGIPIAYEANEGPTSFVAKKCEMLPFECVCRRILTGSWLERNPDSNEGEVADPITFELFFKDDRFRDPLVRLATIYEHGQEWGVFFAHAPLQERPNFVLAADHTVQLDIYHNQLEELTRKTFLILEDAFSEIMVDGEAVVLVDLKIEFGITADGELVVADVIDNDSWRIWKGGKKSGQMDKQVYREIVGEMDPSQRRSLKQLYRKVAVAVEGFRAIP